MGEFSDKATQSEIQELQGTMENSQSQGENQSLLQDLLNQVPSGLFGGKDQAGKADELQANAQAAQMEHTHISPREPEAFTREVEQMRKEVYPVLEWHDEMVQSITEAIEKIPVLPALIEQLQGMSFLPKWSPFLEKAWDHTDPFSTLQQRQEKSFPVCYRTKDVNILSSVKAAEAHSTSDIAMHWCYLGLEIYKADW